MTIDLTTELDLLSIPAEFVDVNFEMDPKTDDLIRGREVTEGMIVLWEGSGRRIDPAGHELGVDHECDPYNCPRLLTESRWCKVTKIERHSRDLLTFIGVYADGTKRSRAYNLSYCWFVKLDSSSRK